MKCNAIEVKLHRYCHSKWYTVYCSCFSTTCPKTWTRNWQQ